MKKVIESKYFFPLGFLDVMMSILHIHAAVLSFCQFVTNTSDWENGVSLEESVIL